MPKLIMRRLDYDVVTKQVKQTDSPPRELHVNAFTPVFLSVTNPAELLSQDEGNRSTVGSDNKIHTPELKVDLLANYLLARGNI